MKRFNYVLKSALAIAAIFSASLMSAQLTRVPDPGKAQPTAEQLAAKEAQQGFQNFIRQMREANSPTVGSAAAPAQFNFRQRPENPLRTSWDPQGNLYVIVPNFFGINSYSDAFYGRLYPETGTMSKIWRDATLTNGDEAYLQSGFIRDDIAYIPQVSWNTVTGEGGIIWKRFDISSGKTLTPLHFGSGPEAFLMFCYSMTYDDIHDVVYGVSYDNNSGLGGGIIKVDCSKPVDQWAPEYIFNAGGQVDNWMAGICYDPLADTLYGLKSQGVLCEIDIDSKKTVDVMQYDDMLDEFCFPPIMQSLPMCYSPRDKAILFVYGSQNAVYSLCSIDSESYEPYMISQLNPTSHVGNLYCTDPFAVDDAPDAMASPTLSFNGNSLNGTFTVKAPTTNYMGIKLEQNMTLHVLVDDKEVFTKEVAPGENVTGNLELTQGKHIVAAYCSLGDLMGPKTFTRIYAGNDQPQAPTGLKLLNGVLSWTAPSRTGVNNGYLDLSNVTYDVYVNEQKLNKEPITKTSYNLDYVADDNNKKKITVTATANGVTSEKSSALMRSLGKGLDLPINMTPTKAEADLFTTYNANNDAYEWEYTSYSGEPPYWMIHTSDYTVSPNDWLFMPAMYFDSSDEVYNLTVTYGNARRNNTQKDNLDIYIGTDPTPEGMTRLLYRHEARIQDVETDLNMSFNIDKPGRYYIAFYSKPGNETRYRGITLRNFRIGKSGVSTQVPGQVTDIKLTPAPLAEMFVTVEAKLPTVDMAGDPLPADQTITLSVQAGTNTPKEVSGKPGESVKTVVDVDKDGYADIFLTPSNSYGNGGRQYVTAYVGLDNPLPPTNVKAVIDADNLGMVVTWDPVGNVGEHGGYVDTADVNYDFYSQSTTGSTRLGTAGKETTYHYRISNINPIRCYVGPVAVNQMGISTNGTFVDETLGRLYTTPALEEWGTSQFAMSRWVSSTGGSCSWGHLTESDGSLGDIVFGVGGALQAEGSGTARLTAPRISTKTDPHAYLELRYWNYPNSGTLEVVGKSYGNQEFRKIAEFTPTRPSKGQWDYWKINLPADFCQQDWVQLDLIAHNSMGQTVVLDYYKVAQDIDSDFQLTSLAAPYSAFAGEEAKFDIVVSNTGSETAGGKLIIELLGEGNPLYTEEVEIERVRTGEEFEYQALIPILEKYALVPDIQVHAHTEADGDMNGRNDDKYVDFLIFDSPVPVVRDLKAERSDNDGIDLSWSQPKDNRNGLESFETYTPFTLEDNIGPWTNIDVDGLAPFTIQQKRWGNDDKPCAWTLFDADKMNTLEEPRMSPHSGKQMLMARSIAYDVSTEAPTRSMDFLISPEVKGGSKISFWINTLDSQYAETVAIWYSSTTPTLSPEDVVLNDRDFVPRECGEFKWLKNFTKSGSETWEYCEMTLPEDAKYFAFVYSSFGMFGAMIDDIQCDLLNPAPLNIDSYDIFASYDEETPVLLVREVPTPGYHLDKADGRPTTYYVKTNVLDGENLFSSALSNPARVAANGVDGLEAGEFVGGGKGRILVGGAEGKNCTIYDVDGKVMNRTIINSDRQTFIVEAGIYLVKLGDASVKIIVR